jgi:hypothetical protein
MYGHHGHGHHGHEWNHRHGWKWAAGRHGGRFGFGKRGKWDFGGRDPEDWMRASACWPRAICVSSRWR